MSRKIVFTKSQQREIIRLFQKERLSTSKIGKMFGTSCNTIINFLRDSGIEVSLSKIRTKHFTEKQTQDIICSYNNGRGETTVQLGKRYDCSYATIRRVLKENNAFNPTGSPVNKIYFEQDQQDYLLEAYSSGRSAKSLSIEMGVSDSVILSFLHEHGIDTNDYGRGKPPKPVVFKEFTRTCRSLSRRIFKTHKKAIDRRYRSKTYPEYHIDHKFSIHEGKKCNLTVLDLAHPVNLHILKASDNLAKHVKCLITKRELLNSIKDWNKRFGDPFEDVDMEIEYNYRYGRYNYFSGTYTHFKVYR